jgi:Zn finger protein HypA/HybF involved in hydrogenase expression
MMPEIPNAYKCDYCHKLMEPIEQKDNRWHTKWCSACGAKLYDVFIGKDLELHQFD